MSNKASDIRDLYGDGDETASQEFAKILDDEQPNIVHLHAFTRGVSLRIVREAKRRKIKVVFTYHTPTVSCQRGSLMRWGTEVCDGVLEVHRCAACTLHGLGLNQPIAQIVGSFPPSLSSLPGKCALRGGLWTALRMTELVALRHSAFRSLMLEVDRVVALCHWTKDLLLRNGVQSKKITISRHGISQISEGRGQKSKLCRKTAEVRDQKSDYEIRRSKSEMPIFPRLRIAFFGRLEPIKGPDLLIRAVRSLPDASLELHLYGIAQGEAGTGYLSGLKKLAAGDPRITFFPAVSTDRTVEVLRGYDLLAVPSRWLETGPLVVLEAFAAGVPVLGSNLGGIAELVQHQVNGLLLAPDSVEAWSQAFRRCYDDDVLLEQLRRGIRPPRRMYRVASEMMLLYGEVADLPLFFIPYDTCQNETVHTSS